MRGGAIDVHHHFLPPGQSAGPRPWSPQASLDQMERFGIGVAILSMTQNGDLLYNGTEKGRTEIRRGNDYGAELVQKYPKQFGQMGGVPLPDLDGSLKEIEYVYDTLKVDAIGIYSNDNQGRWPGDPYFEPMWQELNRRRAIVYMHPLAPPCCGNLKYGPAASMLEYDFDVTRGVASIVVNGVMFRYPNIRFITVHSGGTVPMLAGRMKDRVPAGAREVPAERPLCGAAEVVLRHRARQLPLADGRDASLHARIPDPLRHRLLAGADRVHGERAAGAVAAEGVRADDAARQRRAAVPEVQGLTGPTLLATKRHDCEALP